MNTVFATETAIPMTIPPAEPESENRPKAAMRYAYASGSTPLPGYTIKRGVGRGGFGEVYFAVSDAGLRGLMSDNPPYVPAFFMLAQHLVKREESLVNEARTVLRAGIEVARHQGNDHAAGEMSEFLASLGEAGE